MIMIQLVQSYFYIMELSIIAPKPSFSVVLPSSCIRSRQTHTFWYAVSHFSLLAFEVFQLWLSQDINFNSLSKKYILFSSVNFSQISFSTQGTIKNCISIFVPQEVMPLRCYRCTVSVVNNSFGWQ